MQIVRSMNSSASDRGKVLCFFWLRLTMYILYPFNSGRPSELLWVVLKPMDRGKIKWNTLETKNEEKCLHMFINICEKSQLFLGRTWNTTFYYLFPFVFFFSQIHLCSLHIFILIICLAFLNEWLLLLYAHEEQSTTCELSTCETSWLAWKKSNLSS